jgi:hypothetical protein
MNPNFDGIVWLAGHFGIVIREQVEELIYRNKYSFISANRTLSKLEKELRLLKRVDRGKRKTDGYKLTNDGAKYFRRHFGYEPKMYNSGDKLNHSINILNFYVHIINDMKIKGLIQNEYNIIEEKRKIVYRVQKQLKFVDKKDNIKIVEPDAFLIYYRFQGNRARICWVEIENSERKAVYVAKKTLDNYENYFLSGEWKKESWQPKAVKVFPYILIVAYSDFKARELIKEFKKRQKIEHIQYFFSDYRTLKENGISGEVWKNINGQKISIF